jgi:peptide/nickel transport system permease protein
MNAAPLTEFLRHSVLARVGLVVALLLLFAALFAPWIAPADPASQNLAARLHPPSAAHWMGTDELGRDIFSRILFGARISLFVSVCVVLGCGLIGLTLGTLAGYHGKLFDRVINLLFINAFLSFPGVLLAIAFAAFFGPGIGKVILALIITGWAGYARLARAQVLKVKELEYVLAARSLGASQTRIILRHVLPNILQPIMIHAQFSWIGSTRLVAQLGRHAQRRAQPPFRRTAHGGLSRASGPALCLSF